MFVSVCYLTYSCGHTSHALDLVEMQQLNETEYKMPLRNLQNFVSPAPARPRRALPPQAQTSERKEEEAAMATGVSREGVI